MKIPREEEGRIIAQSRFDVNEEIGTEKTFLQRVSVVGVEHLGLRDIFSVPTRIRMGRSPLKPVRLSSQQNFCRPLAPLRVPARHNTFFSVSGEKESGLSDSKMVRPDIAAAKILTIVRW